ncbi:MAG: hypothetical protein R3268_02750 [Acidiferrobacterales bacterium]|nr:hypothetical protein [Acidiferrobacterales bacterium]
MNKTMTLREAEELVSRMVHDPDTDGGYVSDESMPVDTARGLERELSTLGYEASWAPDNEDNETAWLYVAGRDPMNKTITGLEAIEYARENGLTLDKYADPVEDAREGLSVAEAEEVAREDASLIWMETE